MQRVNSKNYTCLVVISIISFFGCSNFNSSEYSRLVAKELAKNTRADSLFLGIYLGMPAKAFYDHCWDLNKKGMVTNGTTNVSVLYKIDRDLKYPASMNFYPDFYGNKIFRMRASFEYDAWAPWNRSRYADSLLPYVLNMYRKWYAGGNDFIKIF